MVISHWSMVISYCYGGLWRLRRSGQWFVVSNPVNSCCPGGRSPIESSDVLFDVMPDLVIICVWGRHRLLDF